MYFSQPRQPTMTTHADDLKYILAEEGRYSIEEENNIIMNEGIDAIDIEEILYVRPTSIPTSSSLTEINSKLTVDRCACSYWDTEETHRKKVTSDQDVGDYETPDDIKTRGGENYHINKHKTKPNSPKNERRQVREKRVNDIRTKDSRCHKKAAASLAYYM